MGDKKKTVLIIVGIVVVLVIAGLFYIYNSFIKLDLVPAQLHVESGAVHVDGKSVTGNIKLKKGSVIETLDGLATVILYESVLVSLSENTRVKVEELILKHPKLSQESGKTWSKFTKLFGVNDYTANTGNSVASVRATAFQLSENKIISGEGQIDFTIDGKSFVVNEGKVVEKIDGEIIERDATPEELAEIGFAKKRTINELKYLRSLEIQKHRSLIKWSDEEIKQKLDEADAGNVDVDQVVQEINKQVPLGIEPGPVKKVAGITKIIQELSR